MLVNELASFNFQCCLKQTDGSGTVAGEKKQSFTVKWVVFSPWKHVNVGQELKFLRMRLGHNHSGK